jgi:TetR/AcrR family transcriptional regulator, ethionamide resistance regulator
MTVEGVMAHTGLSRPAFYAYFRDRYDLVTRMLEGIGGLLFAVDRRWLAGGDGGGREEAREVLVDTLRRGSETFVRYGPVLRAIADAASQDPRVEEVYRFGLIERLVGAVAARISRDVEAGVSPDELDPEDTARALVLMTERYLFDAFGCRRAAPRARKPQP